MDELVQYYYDLFDAPYSHRKRVLPVVSKKRKKRPKQKKQKRQFIIGKYAYVSAGIIFYRIKEGIPHYLLIERNDNARFKYEDLGGKISDEDEDIVDIAAREAAEESNAAFVERDLDNIKKSKEMYEKALNKSIEYIKGIIGDNNIQPRYFPEIKYAIYMIPFPETPVLDKENLYNFGDTEIVHDPTANSPIKRSIKWYSEFELRKINIKNFNPRIRILMNSLRKQT